MAESFRLSLLGNSSCKLDFEEDNVARDLSIYLNTTTPSSDEDLDASDDRLLEIIDLFEKRKLTLSANKATEMAEAGIFDIRPLSYVLFVTYYEEGIVALAAIFDVVLAILGPQRAMIGPQRNQASFFAKRLSWLWATMNDYLAYYRKENGADWKRMRQGLTTENLADILDRGKKIAASLTDASQERVATTLASFMGEVRMLAAELEAAARASAAAPAGDDDAEEEKGTDEASTDEEESESEGEEASNAESAPVVAKANRAGKRTVTLEVSPAFLELLNKLKAFETLAEQGDLAKAAIVADDIQSIIENFDPRVHFPGLLSRFSELLAMHSETLGELLDNRDSFSWKTMAQFYKVDLEKFVAGDGNARARRR